MSPAFRCFEHPDGRKWQVRASGPALELRIDTGDGDWVERKRTLDDSDAASKEEATLAAQQLAEGFREISVPRWLAFLDQLIEHWRLDDPSFDTAALKQSLLEHADPQATMEAVMALAANWVTDRRGTTSLSFDTDDQPRLWLERRLPQVLPGLLLALRHPDYHAQLEVESILSKAPKADVIEALMSVVEHPAPNLASHLGGRPQHLPSFAIHKLGRPDPAVAARLIAMLAHEDFRVSTAAAKVLCEFADDDALFAPLWKLADSARESDGACWALMRAAEVRRDPAMRPFLEWMLASRRFRSAGYPERIREALAGLR